MKDIIKVLNSMLTQAIYTMVFIRYVGQIRSDRRLTAMQLTLVQDTSRNNQGYTLKHDGPCLLGSSASLVMRNHFQSNCDKD